MIDYAGQFPDNIRSLVKQMIALAVQSDEDVSAKFDGINIVVAPDTKLEKAMKAFREARHELLQVKQ